MALSIRLRYIGGESIIKKAVIVISLVEESAEMSNEEIERGIVNELSKEPTRIPWLKEVEKVTVTEE
jgi:hypothetical protein